MKRKSSVVDARRNKILDLLKELGMVKVEDLAKQLDVSPLTIRRDLDLLESTNRLERFCGGACLGKDHALAQSDNHVADYVQAIAACAAGMVEDGDIIFINTSYTAISMIPYITKRVTVITNNGNVFKVKRPPGVTVLLAGGELQGPKNAMTGEFAVNNLSRVTATKSFLGCSGFSVHVGMTTALMNEVSINKLMLTRVTGPTYILADSRKIGEESNFVSSSPNHIKNIITDELVSPEKVDEITSRGISIIQVSRNGTRL